MKIFETINNFTRGEIGQRVSARVDSDSYKHSCEFVDNFIPQVQGGLKKRNGFRVVPDDIVGYEAIHAFRYSTTEDFRVYMKKVVGKDQVPSTDDHIACRVYSNNSYNSVPFDFEIPCRAVDLDFDNLDLKKLQVAQWQDLLFCVDTSGINPPFYLYRRDAGTIASEEVAKQTHITISAIPNAGSYELRFEGEIAEIFFDDNIAVIEEKLNAMSSVETQGGLFLTGSSYGYTIIFYQDPIQGAFTLNNNTLTNSETIRDPETGEYYKRDGSSSTTILHGWYSRYFDPLQVNLWGLSAPEGVEIVNENTGNIPSSYSHGGKIYYRGSLQYNSNDLRQWGVYSLEEVGGPCTVEVVEETVNIEVPEPNVDGYVFAGAFWCDEVPEIVRINFNNTEQDLAIPTNVTYGGFMELSSSIEEIGDLAVDGINYSKYPYEYLGVTAKGGDEATDDIFDVLVEERDISTVLGRYESSVHIPAILRDDNVVHVACLAKLNSADPDAPYLTCYYDTESETDKSATEEALTYITKKTYIDTETKVIKTGFLKDFNVLNEVPEVKRLGLPEWRPRNWPRSICIHQQRLIFGGTRDQPTKVWCSKIGEPFIFITQPRTYWDGDVADTTAFSFKPVSKKADPITAMDAMNTLFVQTHSSLFNVSSNGPFNLRTITIDKEHGTGASIGNPTIAKDSMYYVDVTRRKIGAISYGDGNTRRSTQEKITDQNGDILYNGFDEEVRKFLGTAIEDVVIDKILWDDGASVLWCLNSIGALFGCRIDRENGLLGFFRVNLGVKTYIKDISLQSNTRATTQNLLLMTVDNKVLAYAETKMLPVFEIEDREEEVDGILTSSAYLDQNNPIYLDYAQTTAIADGENQLATGYPKTRICVFEYEKGVLWRQERQYFEGDSVFYIDSYFTCIETTVATEPFDYSKWKLRKTKYVGEYFSDRDGVITLPEGLNEIIWGVPYNSVAKTNPISRYNQRQSEKTRVSKGMLKTYLSRGGRVGTSYDNTVDIDYKSYNNLQESYTKESNMSQELSDRFLSGKPHLGNFDHIDEPLFTGFVEVDLISDSEPWEGIVFEQDEPFPFYVVGMFAKGVI